MIKRIIITSITLLLFTFHFLLFTFNFTYGMGFLVGDFSKYTESDQISYFAPCWGSDNKIYFIKNVTHGVYSSKPVPIVGGNYLVDKSEVYLCSMNYDGTDKKEIVKIGDTDNGTYWLPMYLDYCQANDLILLSGGMHPASGETYNGIYTIGIDGSNMKKLSDVGLHASWSPDGKQIVYQHGDVYKYDSTIWVMNANGSNKHQISKEKVLFPAEFFRDAQGRIVIEGGKYKVKRWGEGYADESPIWSPKGDLIAFVCKGWICIMKPDGSERRKVCNTRHLSDWSPDGTMLMTDAGRGIIDLKGNTIKEIWASGRWSPNGKLFIASPGFNIYTIDGKELKHPLSVGVPPKHGEHFTYKKPNNIW